jgi:uncharacterized membrane protein YccC
VERQAHPRNGCRIVGDRRDGSLELLGVGFVRSGPRIFRQGRLARDAMTVAGNFASSGGRGAAPAFARIQAQLATARPMLVFGVRLWVSACLALFIAFWLELDNAYWAGTSAAIVCQPQVGASLRKGWFRMLGTMLGAIAAVVMAACFPQDRVAFLTVLALWGAACAVVATLLRNFASYSAALAGYTAAIISCDSLGAVGGLNGQAFTLAYTRASEICIGIVCAGVVLGLTDLGGARRRLALLFAELSSEIARGFSHTLALAGAEFAEIQLLRRQFVGRVIALDSVLDQSLGESSQLRYHSPVLQHGVDGLFAAMAAWRNVSPMLSRLPSRAAEETGAVLACLPEALRTPPGPEGAARWADEPVVMRAICDAAYPALRELPATTPSARLLADQVAALCAALSRVFNALVLLGHASPVRNTQGARRIRIPDLLPALVNGGRAFVMIGAVALLWIVTEWPSGALAIEFVAIGVILLPTRGGGDPAGARNFIIGTILATVFAAVIAFAVLPKLDTFLGFCLAIGLVLVPGGAGMAQPRATITFVPIASFFIPLLGPANQETYDTVAFYNTSLAIVAGLFIAVLSFALLPPLSPAYRTRRLLAFGLRDLRRLILRPRGRKVEDWEGCFYGRLTALPDQAAPLERAQLVAVLAVGAQIIELRRTIGTAALGRDLDTALAALIRQGVAPAVDRLANVDRILAAAEAPTVLRARAGILAISEALTQHAPFFAMSATA